jgi:hypothetical protein
MPANRRRGLFCRTKLSYDDAMQLSHAVDQHSAPSAVGGFSAVAFFLALAIGPVVGLVWGWVADAVQFYVSPLLLFPIMVGVFTGLTIVGLARFAQVGHRPTILLAVVLAASVAACGQHYLHFLLHYSRVVPAKAPGNANTTAGLGEAMAQAEAASKLGAIPKEMSPSFAKYLLAQAKRGRPLPGGWVAAGWLAWLTWAIDALLTVATAVAVTLPAVRIPYCNRCGTWYRTIRNGKIDVATAQRLAEICNAEEVAGLHSPRYRLSCCQGGCGPTRCELSWEEPDGTVDLFRVWLDAEQRAQVAGVLDGMAEEIDD